LAVIAKRALGCALGATCRSALDGPPDKKGIMNTWMYLRILCLKLLREKRKIARMARIESFLFDVEPSTQQTLIDFLPAPDVGLISAILVTTMS